MRYLFEKFELQPDERRLLGGGRELRIGPHAFDVLLALAERAGHLVTKDELLERVWPKVVVEENTLQVHISALRKVIGADAIATVPGRGYRFMLGVTRDTPAPASPPVPTNNLPHPLTSFIGREKEIADLKRLLGIARLLTLTGAGGCGKTRLALQVARQTLGTFPDGAWLVELAPIAFPDLTAHALAQALSVKEQPGRDLVETVAERIGAGRVLLLLDNAEHLLEPCAHAAELLLRRCGALTILVTSRERLRVAGEAAYRVPSLAVPDPRREMSNDEVLACEATRLFIDRARLQRPDLELTASDAAPLASICSRLDGIALAIELAAPCVRVMSIEELSHRLDDRFRVLTEGSRTALPRHRTLRSLVDWSHDLLTPAEKAVLRRASVFSGGWTLEAAQHVCSGGGDVDPGEVLDLVTSLADKNLVMADAQGGVTRFTMLETVRHYARDRLVESGDVHAYARHVEHFLGMATKLHQDCTDDERQAMLDRVEKEYDNFRAAMGWCEANTTHTPAGLRLAARLNWFWRTRGSFSEGRAWIARLLAASPGDEGDEDHAWALNTVGVLAYFQDDYVASEAGYRAALAIWRRLGNREREAAEVTNLGHLAYTQGELDVARQRYEEALGIARELGDPRGLSVRLRALGILARETGDLAGAEALLEECVSVSHEVGSWSVAQALGNLGWVKHLRGDREGARPLIVESLEGERKFGNKAGVALNLIWLGILSHEDGDIPAARAHLMETLAIHLELGVRSTMVDALDAFARLSLDLGDATCAGRIWGGAQRLREEIGAISSTLEKERLERDIGAARAALRDDAAFDRAWREGRTMSLDEVVRYALTL